MNREYYIELLKSLVVSDYVYIDYPMYLNIGDSFIALGAIELLSNIPYKCRYFSSYSCFDYKKIREDDVIIMHGGGNFGDLYKGANEFRNEIIRKFPNNKIIFFPQTIFYENVEGLSKDAEIMNRHSDLTVLVRDKRSFDLARGYFTNNIILFPDTAFFLDLNKKKVNFDYGMMCLFRKDKEKVNCVIQKNVELKDWDDILCTNMTFKRRMKLLKVISYFRRKLPLGVSFFSLLQNKYFIKQITPLICDIVIDEFSKYSKIITTRLHGAILASMLDIDFEIIDNTYGKLSDYFSTWFPDAFKDNVWKN